MNRATYLPIPVLPKPNNLFRSHPHNVRIPQTNKHPNKPPLLCLLFQQTKKEKRKQESQIILIPQERQRNISIPTYLPCSCPDAGETLKYMYAAELAPLNLYRKNYRTGSGSKKNTRVKMKSKRLLVSLQGTFRPQHPGFIRSHPANNTPMARNKSLPPKNAT